MQRSLREQNIASLLLIYSSEHVKRQNLSQGILHISTCPFCGTMILIFTTVGTGIPEDHSEHSSRCKGQYYEDQHQSKMCQHSLKEGLFTVVGKKNKKKFLTVLLLNGQRGEHHSYFHSFYGKFLKTNLNPAYK